MGGATIQFTQEQVRDLTRVTPGDIRQWRKWVPYLAGKSGKAARFAYSDLIGLALVREMITAFHVRMSEVGIGVDALFHALAAARPAHLEGLVALVERGGARLVSDAEMDLRHLNGMTIVARCDPILATMAARMMPINPEPHQRTLPFPSRVVQARP